VGAGRAGRPVRAAKAHRPPPLPRPGPSGEGCILRPRMSQPAAAEGLRARPGAAWPNLAVLGGPAYQDGSVLANRAGLQLARIAAVNLSFRARRKPVAADLRGCVETYERDGVVVLEN